MRSFTFTERVDDKIVALHHVNIPEWSEAYGKGESPYWQIGSYNVFNGAQAKIVNGSFKNGVYPRWFYGIDKHEHDQMQEFNAGYGFNMYEGVPVFNHTSMWTFYDHIGWDRKRKRFK